MVPPSGNEQEANKPLDDKVKGYVITQSYFFCNKKQSEIVFLIVYMSVSRYKEDWHKIVKLLERVVCVKR